MRLVAGRFRGKPLAAPPGRDIRPTSDRAREGLFNILEHGRNGIDLDGARVLDAFAGTGAVGLEALSRGARHVTFIENARAARLVLNRNIAACGAQDSAVVLEADATSPPPTNRPVGFAFLDPPYRAGLAEPALVALNRRGWFDDDTLIVVETGSAESFTPPDGFEERDRRRYGAAQFVFLSRSGSAQ